MRGYLWFWGFALSVMVSLGAIVVLVVDFFYPNPPWGEMPPVGYVGAMGVSVIAVGVMIALSMTRPDGR
ncbi:hypothetical protein Hrd1104_11370 [Halorhabdus sp. CBA1104]|uniref:hypothetical protein n=1 Tax=unclassified Halorhabdus TaxID=2621901 RepID=UPI0012B3ABDF|nr:MULTISPECIES: hypothetical protein [unclassified Halorhabdus]QGN07841.1 hypothetical protein Hrd1104_11370 [Halorhabdus sp. CBA1104]